MGRVATPQELPRSRPENIIVPTLKLEEASPLEVQTKRQEHFVSCVKAPSNHDFLAHELEAPTMGSCSKKAFFSNQLTVQ